MWLTPGYMRLQCRARLVLVVPRGDSAAAFSAALGRHQRSAAAPPQHPCGAATPLGPRGQGCASRCAPGATAWPRGLRVGRGHSDPAATRSGRDVPCRTGRAHTAAPIVSVAIVRIEPCRTGRAHTAAPIVSVAIVRIEPFVELAGRIPQHLQCMCSANARAPAVHALHCCACAAHVHVQCVWQYTVS